MKINIKKVDCVEECKDCNQMLSELMQYETSFDNTIVPNLKIENHYEKMLNKDDCVMFLASCDERPIGYVAAYKNTPKNTSECFVTIMNLYVKPQFRGEGIGKLLVREVEVWGKETFSIITFELDCFINNKSAIGFYEKLDFKPIRVKMRKSNKH